MSKQPDSFEEWYAARDCDTRRYLYEHYWIKNLLRDVWDKATEAQKRLTEKGEHGHDDEVAGADEDADLAGT